MKYLNTIITLLLLAFIAEGATAQTVHNAYGKPENFSDVVLIYAGNSNRNSWNTKQLTPYVTHTYADGSEQWFFDCFLFLEFVRDRTINGSYTSVGFGNGMGGAKPATQEDWKWILDEYLTTGDSFAITKIGALDKVITEKKQKLGDPGFRHKVIIVCPAPKKDGTTWSSATWGTVNGQAISLNSKANRLKAEKWYIDELVSRWNACGYKNLDLEGIYWVEESMYSNADIIAEVNDYARSKGLRSYWIPYYRDGNEGVCQKWESSYKFDMAYYQPNYAFIQDNGTTLPLSSLTKTTAAAKKYGAGLEVEFETSGASNALHSVNAALHQRINDYMDVYTSEGVFANAGVAYYVGSRGLNDMNSSTDPVDHATMDRMASIVLARLQAKYGNFSALEKIEKGETDWAFPGKGSILTTTPATCYDLSGRLVHSGVGRFDCPAGIYILNNGKGDFAKLIVK